MVSDPTASDISCFQMANNDIHIFSHITILCRFHQPNKNKSVTYTLTLPCIKVCCNNRILFYEAMFTSSTLTLVTISNDYKSSLSYFPSCLLHLCQKESSYKNFHLQVNFCTNQTQGVALELIQRQKQKVT